MQKRRIVVVGGGFGGVYCAKHLSERLKHHKEWEVVLLSMDSYLLFYPLLIKVAVGEVEPRHASIYLRGYLKYVKVVLGKFTDLVATRSEICYQPHLQDNVLSLNYDHLVFALGSGSDVPNIPGLKEKVRLMQSIDDAVKSRRLLLDRLEEAESLGLYDRRDLQRKLLSFAVIGGGYTGIELASDLKEFLNEVTKNYPSIDKEDASVHLIEMTNQLLPGQGEKLAKVVARRLQQQGVEIHLGEAVKKVQASYIQLESGKSFLADTIYWCGGVTPPDVLKDLPLPKSDKGMILTTPYLNVAGHRNIWAIGDCAANVSPDGKLLPPTAQIANKLARHLVRNILNAIKDKPWLASRVKSSGMMIPLGQRFAAIKMGRFVFKGKMPWYLWCIYHSLKIPQFSHKLKISFELLIDSLFGRNVGDPGLRQKSKSKENRVA
ncbi:MAG: NAD(P)/FAD-dependent oxidoreductase [Oligoflexus sp.]